jgi:site-specific DNA-methyltransferase (adenine-specific)
MIKPIIDSKYLPLNHIYQGDARDLLRQIEPESIACSIWSPPYHTGKKYEEGMSFEAWKALLREVIKYHYPILKPGGFLAVNIADILAFPNPNMPKIQAEVLTFRKQKITKEDVLAAMKEHPDLNRYQLAELLGCSEQTIDRRLHDNNIRGGKYKTQTCVKLVGGYIEQFGEEAGLYLYDRRVWVKDPTWENSRWHSLSYRSVDEFEYIYIFWKPGITVVDRHRLDKEDWATWGSRGVWFFPSVRANYQHEAMFPLELPKRLIKLLTDKGDVVLDCFMGSGTTAFAAIQEERKFIGIDLDENYAKMAEAACSRELNRPKIIETKLQ